jgi:plasmid stabilization system protein ParE
MDYQVIWWREALGDVDKIAEYIAKDSPLYAQSVIEQLITNSRNILFVVA